MNLNKYQNWAGLDFKANPYRELEMRGLTSPSPLFNVWRTIRLMSCGDSLRSFLIITCVNKQQPHLCISDPSSQIHIDYTTHKKVVGYEKWSIL